MVHSKRLLEWVSAQQVPGVWQLCQHDEADTPSLPMPMRDNGPPAEEYQRISAMDGDDNLVHRVNVAAWFERLCDAGEA